MSEQKLKTLYCTLNTMMGEGMGNYLLDSELRRLNLRREGMTEQGLQLLTENLRTSFEPLLGKDGINYLLDASR